MYPGSATTTIQRIERSYYASLVGFPISCFVLTLLTDLAYWKTASYLWVTFSVWLLTVGLLGAAATFVAGIVDLVRRRGLGEPGLRLAAHLVAALLALVNVFVHSRDGYTAVVPQGLILSALTVLVLIAGSAVSTRPPARDARFGGRA